MTLSCGQHQLSEDKGKTLTQNVLEWCPISCSKCVTQVPLLKKVGLLTNTWVCFSFQTHINLSIKTPLAGDCSLGEVLYEIIASYTPPGYNNDPPSDWSSNFFI